MVSKWFLNTELTVCFQHSSQARFKQGAKAGLIDLFEFDNVCLFSGCELKCIIMLFITTLG